VGVTAHNGGATLLTNPDNLQYAAGINMSDGKVRENYRDFIIEAGSNEMAPGGLRTSVRLEVGRWHPSANDHSLIADQ
jgi:hypothetical protein